jgi:hypothetical protein
MVTPELKVLSITLAVFNERNFVRTNAGPFPGFTCKNSMIENKSSLNLITIPFLISAVVAMLVYFLGS